MFCRAVFIWPRGLVWALVLACGLVRPAAADEFLGVLGLTADDEVAQAVQLTPTQREKLLELVEAREAEAVELAVALREASPEDRRGRLAAFRQESERRAQALLSVQQRALLEGVRIRRIGMAAAAEPAVAARLNLTPEQVKRISEIATHRDAELAAAGRDRVHVIRAEAERAMASVLSQPQRGALEGVLAGQPGAAPPPAPAPPFAAGPSGAEGPPLGSIPPPATVPPMATAPGQRPVALSDPAGPTAATAVTAATAPADDPLAPSAAATPGKLKFSFRFQPWGDVLDWFAAQAGLSMMMDAPPPGTFNYTDDREYTPAEALDVLNSVLLTKGYTLVRRERMLMVVNLEDLQEGIPPNLLSTIRPDELDSRGEYELVRVLFSLEKLTSEEAAEEINKLIGRPGEVITLPKSRQVLVTGTAGRLRTIRRVLDRVEDPEGLRSVEFKAFELKNALPDEALLVVRRLLDMPDDATTAPDKSISLTADPVGARILATGKPEQLARVEEIVRMVDQPSSGAGAGGLPDLPPQLVVYPIVSANPQSVLSVMQTLLENQPGARLALDETTGHLIAMAKPADHATIRATLEQLQQDARQVEVIQLTTVDPQLAVLSINKLFDVSKDAGARAPQVDADPTTRQLLIRASRAQIDQIRTLLEKMGESLSGTMASSRAGNVRILPLSGRSARSALERIQEIWPTMSPNRIRVVTPSAVAPTLRSSGIGPDALPGDTLPEDAPPWREPPIPQSIPAGPPQSPTHDAPAASKPSVVGPANASPSPAPPRDRTAADPRARVWLVAQRSEPAEVENTATGDAAAGAGAENSPEPAPIIVAPGPGGIMIASRDVAALDQFERLLTQLAGDVMAGGEPTVFYLTHAKAASVAQTLDQIFGGGTLTGGGGSRGGSLLGDLAGAAMGDAGGGIVGALLGGGGSGGSVALSGSLRITPDPRLNALIVQGNPTDLDMIEQLLRILDQKESPQEVLAVPRWRLIPVVNTQAEKIAEIVKQVYQDRLVTTGQGARQPTPQEFIQMLRGGRGGGGSQGGGADEEVQKMSIGVDSRTNSLVVVAPDSLFAEVRDLVERLDERAVSSNQAVRVVTLQRASPAAVQQALSVFAGDAVQFGGAKSGQPATSTTAAGPTATPATQPGGGSQVPQFDPGEVQRRMQRMQEWMMRRGTREGGRSGDSGRRGGR